MDATTIGTLGAALGVGVAAGAHTATWGMFKDAPHEGFTWRKYGRSIAISALVGPAATTVAGLDATRAAGATVLFGLVYAVERALVEFHKTFIREEDQSKYAIPMQFAVLGKVVKGRRHRWAAAGAVLAATSLLAVWVASMDAASLPPWAIVAIGGAAGWVSAIGGAWKDAPVEGFHSVKFFRSPAIAGAFALLLSHLDTRMIVVALCALGYTVAVTETYKTFLFPSKPRGKWAGKPVVHPEWLRLRRRFIPLYAGIWALVVVALSQALSSATPREKSDVSIGRRGAAGGVVRVRHEIDAEHAARPSPREEAFEVRPDVPLLVDPLPEALVARLDHDPVGAHLPHEGHDRGLLVEHGLAGQGAGPHVRDFVGGLAAVLGDQHTELRAEVVALAPQLAAPAGGGGVVGEPIDLPAPGEDGMLGQRDQAGLVSALDHATKEGDGRSIALSDPAERGVDIERPGEGRHLPDQRRGLLALEGDDVAGERHPRGVLALPPIPALPAVRHVELDGSLRRRLPGERRAKGGRDDDREQDRGAERHDSLASRARSAPAGPPAQAGRARRAGGGRVA